MNMQMSEPLLLSALTKFLEEESSSIEQQLADLVQVSARFLGMQGGYVTCHHLDQVECMAAWMDEEGSEGHEANASAQQVVVSEAASLEGVAARSEEQAKSQAQSKAQSAVQSGETTDASGRGGEHGSSGFQLASIQASDALCVQLGALHAVQAAQALSESQRNLPWARAAGMHCLLAGPVRVSDEVFGTLAWFSKRPRKSGFSASDRAWAAFFAGFVSNAISKRSTERALAAATTTLRRLSRIDPVTQLLNAKGLEETMRRMAERQQKGGPEVSVIELRVVGVDRVLGEFGDQVLDLVVCELAQALVAALRPLDMLARTERNVFVALLPETSQASAVGVAERMRRVVADYRAAFRAGVVSDLFAHSQVAVVCGDRPSLGELLLSAQRLVALE